MLSFYKLFATLTPKQIKFAIVDWFWNTKIVILMEIFGLKRENFNNFSTMEGAFKKMLVFLRSNALSLILFKKKKFLLQKR